MEIKELNPLVKRKNFLLRGLYNNNIENVNSAKNEIRELEIQIQTKIKSVLKENEENLKTQSKTIQKTVFEDGNMKRAIARMLINILENELEASDLKGVFRQGYKLMRLKC